MSNIEFKRENLAEQTSHLLTFMNRIYEKAHDTFVSMSLKDEIEAFDLRYKGDIIKQLRADGYVQWQPDPTNRNKYQYMWAKGIAPVKAQASNLICKLMKSKGQLNEPLYNLGKVAQPCEQEPVGQDLKDFSDQEIFDELKHRGIHAELYLLEERVID